MTMGSVEVGSERPLAVSDVGAAAAPADGFWAGYWKTLKSLAVEEPVDVYVHRPLAYVLTKALYRTPITPNMVTIISIVFGLLGAYCFVSSFPHHMLFGAIALVTSAVFDCADGQLARMRGTSSVFGRMLDGVADLAVSIAVVGGGIYVIASKHTAPTPLFVVVLGLCVATAVTGSFHTGMYDHYKNVYLRFTSPTYKDGEDYETARARFEARTGGSFFVNRIAWPIYLFYVKSQADYVHRFDPHTSARLGLFGPYSAERAEIYERHCAGLMRLWRSWFGFGSLVFGIALFSAFEMLEVYMVLRLVALNALFYGYMQPRQRRASRAAFAEMGLSLPDQAKG